MNVVTCHTAKVILALCLLCSCGQRGKSNNAEATTATKVTAQNIDISFQALSDGLTDTLRFGTMHAGEIIEKRLQLTNTDNRPMVLLRHVTSCGCTTIEYERKPIAPSGKSELHFEYNSRAQSGWQMKLMELYFADSDSPLKIYIEAEVE